MSNVITPPALKLGDVTIRPEIEGDLLRSLGSVHVGKTPLRNPATRFLPWFDTFDGDIFRRFELKDINRRGTGGGGGGEITVITTRAVSDPDVIFRER